MQRYKYIIEELVLKRLRDYVRVRVKVRTLNKIVSVQQIQKHSKSTFLFNVNDYQNSKFKQLTSILRNQQIILYNKYATSNVIKGEIISFPLAQTGEGIAECELLKWHIKEGDKINEFDNICQVQSDKASMEITSPYTGIIKSLKYQPGDIIKVGNTLLDIEIDANTKITTKKFDYIDNKVKDKESDILISPAVRHLAKSHNINLNDVIGTGPDRKILRHDIEKIINQKNSLKTNINKIKQIRGYKRGMLESMKKSLQIPTFHLTDEIEMNKLTSIRNILKEILSKEELKFSFMPLIIKAISLALNDYPEMNSSLNEEKMELELKSSHNIGIAMATSQGLVVPNIKNVQNMSMKEITIELNRLKKLAEENNLNEVDLKDGTISISNIGIIGGIYGAPLVSSPEIAIVALGKVRQILKKNKDEIVDVPFMPVCWGADHRIIDGALLAYFNNKFKDYLENPEKMLLYLK